MELVQVNNQIRTIHPLASVNTHDSVLSSFHEIIISNIILPYYGKSLMSFWPPRGVPRRLCKPTLIYEVIKTRKRRKWRNVNWGGRWNAIYVSLLRNSLRLIKIRYFITVPDYTAFLIPVSQLLLSSHIISWMRPGVLLFPVYVRPITSMSHFISTFMG